MIKFYKGLKAKYTYPSNTVLTDAIYFATDTQEILVNGESYGNDNIKIKDVTWNGDTNILEFTKGDDTKLTVNFGDKLLSDADRAAIENLKEALEGAGFTANYETDLDPELTTVNALGGIPANTPVSKYKSKPLSKVIDDLLFPTIQPTIVAPSINLSLKTSTVREMFTNTPVLSEFTLTWNPGSIKIGSKSQGTRAGAKTAEKVYMGTETNEVTSTPGTIIGSTSNYYYKVEYAEGPQPLDSKGGNATTGKLPAGSLTSSAVTVYGVYPFYATTTDANITNKTVTKLPLTKEKIFTVTLAAEASDSKHVFKLPHTITKIELKDPFGNWVSQKLEEFPSTTETIDVNGHDTTYNVYTRNQGQNGTTEFRITYN